MPRHPSRLVLDATHRHQVNKLAGVFAPARTVAAEAHVLAVGAVAAVVALIGTPPVAAAADNAETAIRMADAARQGRKPVLVGTVAARAITSIIPPARRF